MEVYIGVYEYEFKFELSEGSAGDKLSWNKTQKKTEIPVVNGFHVELNFLEGVLSSVSYDDEIGVPFTSSDAAVRVHTVFSHQFSTTGVLDK